MTGEEFAQQLQAWKQELIDDVVSHYRTGSRERGQLAFDRWKERFVVFLKEHVPSEATLFEEAMHLYGLFIIGGEHPYETFMREYGRKCLAFIDDLAESALKGRIVELQQKSPQSQEMLAISPQAFLSYAREDIDSARRLYNDLRESGVNVWFDEASLLPGQRWKTAIRRAIKDSRFFLALLSTRSVNKKGYIQKEIKEALEILDEYPESAIFLIPVRLDACIPSHDRLRDLQWVDMFPDWEEGLVRILKAIEPQNWMLANMPESTARSTTKLTREQVLEARKHFEVEVISFDASQEIGASFPYSDYVRLRITNNSTVTLPYLTVKTKRYDISGKMIGSSRAPSIPTSNLGPGESAEYDYYPKGHLPGTEKITVEIEQLIEEKSMQFFKEFE